MRVVELLLLSAADGTRFVPFQNHRVIENQRNLPSPGTERRRAPLPPVVVGQVPHQLRFSREAARFRGSWLDAAGETGAAL